MAGRINTAPTRRILNDNSPQLDLWFKETTNRMNVYSGTVEPVAADVPDGQWLVYFNTATSTPSFYLNRSGVLYRVNSYIGTATGISVAVTGSVTSSGGGIGYTTGAGGTVTQNTSKSTGVTLNKLSGTITMNGAALAAATTVSFTFTNSFIAATDLVIIQHSSVGTLGAYNFAVTPAAGSASIAVRNVHTASLSQAIVLRFTIIKGVTS